MNALPPGANFDGRLQTVRRQLVKINGIEDEDAKALARARIKNQRQDVLYKGEGLTGTMTNDAYKTFEGEPVGILNGRAGFGDLQRFPAGYGARNAKGQEIAVPIISNANGLRGLHPHEIDAQVTMLGFSDQVGRETNRNRLNIIIGGLITVINSGPDAIMTGDIVMACTPTKEEAINIKARSGNLANTKGQTGRIPFILKPYRPEKFDFFNAEARVKAILALYDVAPASGSITSKAAAAKVDYNNLDFMSRTFTDKIGELCEALTDLIAVADNFTAGVDLTKRDSGLVVAAREKAAQMILYSNYDQLDNVTKGKMKAPAKAILPALQRNPFQAMLVALMSFGIAASNKIMGRAVMSAASGKDFDIHIGHYMR